MSRNRRTEPSEVVLANVRTKPLATGDGKPYDYVVQRQVDRGDLRLEVIPAEVLGLARPLEVYRKRRNGKLITPWVNKDTYTFCPEHASDMMIGQGSCGLRCRCCYLVATHRLFADPSRHILYDNMDDFVRAAARWFMNPPRRSLGIGIDHSDSLLYEGLTGYARQIIPMAASATTNPEGCKLIMLTKSINVHYLEGLPAKNVVVSFSINPTGISDLWEGRFDDSVRVSPTIPKRMEASLFAQQTGFELRWRVDPILHPPGWEVMYGDFFADAVRRGLRPTRITLGMYRTNSLNVPQLARKWGLPPIEWQPARLIRTGNRYREPVEVKIPIYEKIVAMIRKAWHGTGHEPIVAFCKEPLEIHKTFGGPNGRCNCG